MIKIYTDGSCSGNPGPGGAAYLISVDGYEYKGECGYRLTTNNRMEIKAAILALERISWELCLILENRTGSIVIYSDSQLLVNTMTKGWSRKVNNDLWHELDNRIRQVSEIGWTVTFEKVAGHASCKENNIVNDLAVKASRYSVHQQRPDVVYESQNRQMTEAKEVTIDTITLRHHDVLKERHIVVSLSNGTNVRITGEWDGFSQSGGTANEMKLTLPVAERFVGWLNGGDL